MKQQSRKPLKVIGVVVSVFVLAAVTLAAVTYRQWQPFVSSLAGLSSSGNPDDHSGHAHGDDDDGHAGHDHGAHDHGAHDHGADNHAGHDHGADSHAGHDDANALELTELAWKNVGLTTGVVKPETYVRTVSVPAMVVERPGRSQVEITAPLTGIVTRIYPIEGEAVQPEQPLFDLRLTHEDLVTAQRDYLKTGQELDVVNREIARMQAVGEGVIAGRRILEQKYALQRLEAALHAQRQGLLLHGLSAAQIDEILTSRQLLPTLTVVAPPFDDDADHHGVEHLYHVQSIQVKRGQSVSAGAPLAVLADHCFLYVEGRAFEDDAGRLVQASKEGWTVNVSEGRPDGEELQLKILYVADNVDQISRALKFYLSLPNGLVRDEEESGHRFVAWHFRPGQRMEVKIPFGQPWDNQVVLPPEAVVVEGAEAFVFEQNSDHFDRVPVHVLYRGKDAVVVENDGKLTGKTLALSGAYQMNLAIKNKAGGGIDPHAGHNH